MTMKLVFVFVVVGLIGCINAKYKSGGLRPISINNNCNCGVNSRFLLALIRNMDRKLTRCLKKQNPHPTPGSHCPCKKVVKNCEEVLKCGCKKSGVYAVNPDGKGAFKVYCDQKTKGGGWTVIQRRIDGSVNFYRNWYAYKNGFGNLKGEFWLGLDKIYRLTHQTRNRLRVELEETTGKTAYAEYDNFGVSSASTNYKLIIGSYSGTAGDSLSGHRNAPFTTRDKDRDTWKGGNCAVKYKGAWWYTACHASNLNGKYYHGKHKSYADGVNWQKWKGYHYSAKRAEMKIRPV